MNSYHLHAQFAIILHTQHSRDPTPHSYTKFQYFPEILLPIFTPSLNISIYYSANLSFTDLCISYNILDIPMHCLWS
jgi:hypothetical protein